MTYDMVADLPLGSNVDVDVRVWYQAMPLRWVNPMFDIATAPSKRSKPCLKLKGPHLSWFRSCL